MFARPITALLALAGSSLAFLLGVGCGTTTTVSGTSPLGDAGCADPKIVLDAGGSVEPPEAGAPQCPSGVCNYQAQTGCGVGEACRPQFTATSPGVSPGCEWAGVGKSGATCSSSGDCGAGYFCADNACRKQCCHGDWSACDPGESCFRRLEVKAGGVVTDSEMELCFPVGDCDPLDPSSCAQGLACGIVDPTGAVACLPATDVQPGDACGPTSSCAAGALCVNSHCRTLCRAEACGEPACAPGQGTCVHYNRDPQGVGECTPQ